MDSNGNPKQYEVPVLAAACFVADLIIWLLVVILHPVGREVGTLWIVLGLMLYYLYTRVRRGRGPEKAVREFMGSEPSVKTG